MNTMCHVFALRMDVTRDDRSKFIAVLFKIFFKNNEGQKNKIIKCEKMVQQNIISNLKLGGVISF